LRDLNQNNAVLKKGIPLYIAGTVMMATGFILFSMYSISSWYHTFMSLIAFIAAVMILYLGWVTHMGRDTKEFDDSSGGGKHIFLDKPA
jgi:NADH:ubiquinone oxidoreductase subunit 4 (subunit M)